MTGACRLAYRLPGVAPGRGPTRGRALDRRVGKACTGVLAAIVLWTGVVAAQPAGPAESRCTTPPALDDGWEVSAPEASGFDAPRLCAALAAIENGHANVHGVIVERRGRVVAERYRKGPDRPIDVLFGLGNPFAGDVDFDAQTLHDVRSVSKSVVGLLVGIAAAKGRFPDLDMPALRAFDEIADLRGGEHDAIRLEHLLTMTSGLRWDEGALPNDETRLFWTRDPIRFVFDRALDSPPGAKFHYNSGGTAVLADLLTRVSGRPLPEIAREDIFARLGITRWEWAGDLRGRPLAFTGLRMLPRDMAKLGRLVLARGAWRRQQVVPAAWIDTSLRRHVGTGIRIPASAAADLGYGYQWWNGSVAWQGRAIPWSAAFGNGGQRIFVVPDLDVTVVITAGAYGSADAPREVQRLFEAIVSAVAE